MTPLIYNSHANFIPFFGEVKESDGRRVSLGEASCWDVDCVEEIETGKRNKSWNSNQKDSRATG